MKRTNTTLQQVCAAKDFCALFDCRKKLESRQEREEYASCAGGFINFGQKYGMQAI